MKYKIVNNFLDKSTHKLMYETCTGEHFPWYFSDSIATGDDSDEYYFTHVLFLDGKVMSPHFKDFIGPVILGLLGKDIPLQTLMRAKVNMFTKRDINIKHGLHRDFSKFNSKYTNLLYSVNTCNGHTELKDDTKISSVANQLLMFDGEIMHRSVSQTDTKQRINLNINIDMKIDDIKL
jgi:hypothetical protein